MKNIKVGQKEDSQMTGQKEGAHKDPKHPSTTSSRKDNDVLSGPKILDQFVPPPKSNMVVEPARNKDILEKEVIIEPTKAMEVHERVDIPENVGKVVIQQIKPMEDEGNDAI